MNLLKDYFQKFDNWSRLVEEDYKAGDQVENLQEIQKFLKEQTLYLGKEDGLYGPRSRRAIRDILEIEKLREHGIKSILDEPRYDLRDKTDGGPCELRSGGRRRYHFKNEIKPQVIIVHWTAGPYTSEGLYKLFSTTERGVSSHYTIDHTGDIIQMLPATRKAWHAGWINERAIGIDICQPIVKSTKDAADRLGYQTEIIQNTSGRGDRECLSLDPDVLERLVTILQVLEGIHDIPVIVPDNDVVKFLNEKELGETRGVLGHHHVDVHKWDIAPWMESLRNVL